MKPLKIRLTPGEMELLEMLWQHGPLGLAEAHTVLGERIGYTTVQTRLNRMVSKRLAHRSDERPAQYRAAIDRSTVEAHQLELFVDRMGQGGVVPLVAHLVRERGLSSDEITELKRLIAQSEQRQTARRKGGA